MIDNSGPSKIAWLHELLSHTAHFTASSQITVHCDDIPLDVARLYPVPDVQSRDSAWEQALGRTARVVWRTGAGPVSFHQVWRALNRKERVPLWAVIISSVTWGKSVHLCGL